MAPSASAEGMRRAWIPFGVALAFRIAFILAFRLYHFASYENHFPFAWEMGRVARALVTGHGYADPFYGHTGPTAWVTPLYPLLVAAVFRVFGIYTDASGLVLTMLNCVFGALIVFPT
jgi:hypothetical protein